MANKDPDAKYRALLETNPYMKIPKPDDVKDVVDRYENANKNEACWQTKVNIF